MRAYELDLRKRVVAFVQNGGTRFQAAQLFKIGERTVYTYLLAEKNDALAPKKSWGHWRKLDPQKLKAHVATHKDATLEQIGNAFDVSHMAVWKRLKQLGITLKKTHAVSRTRRGAAVAVPARTPKVVKKPGVLLGRVRGGSSAAL